MHFLAGMADQEEDSLNVWEGIMLKDDNKGIMLKDDNNIVKSVKHGGYSNWESGITWLI